MKIRQLAALTFPLLLAPIPALSQPQAPRMVRYQCDGDRTFSVDYAQEVAQLRLDGVNVIPLPRVVSGSGIRYSNGSTTLYSQGNQSFLEEGGQRTYSNCIAQAEAPAASVTSRVFVYQCVDNTSFEARYQPQGVELMLEGRRLTLPQVRSASGARYSDGETTLFTKGDAAFLERNGTSIYDNCVAQAPSPQTSQPANQQPVPSRSVEPEPVRGMW